MDVRHIRFYFVSQKKGKGKGRLYEPNYGYEPYWPGGQWVLYGDPDAPSTEKPVMVGPDECQHMYRDIKEVCGRRVNNEEMIAGTHGYRPSDVFNGYYTFESYCHFLDAEYKSKEVERWVFVHKGPCLDQDLHFQPLWYHTDVFVRAKQRVQELNKVFEQVGVRTTWRCHMCD